MNIQVIEDANTKITIPDGHKEIFKDPVEFHKWIYNQVQHFGRQVTVKYGAVIFAGLNRTWKLDTVISWMRDNVDGRDHFFMTQNGLAILLLTFPDIDTVTRFVLENGDK